MACPAIREVYERYKHMDELFLKWYDDRCLEPPFHAMGDLWMAIKKEMEEEK